MGKSAVTFENVKFKYQSDDYFSLDNISFHVPEGSWTCIVGHNGSGKSTIAKLMSGIEQAASGRITVDGTVLSEETVIEVRNSLGVVLQNPDNQFVGATVEYDVAFGLENRAISEAEMHERVATALQEVNMHDMLQQEPHSLSGGQKQRVAIAGIIAMQPNIILLDEATSMLDPVGKASVMGLIKRLKSEKAVTIISVTHDLSEAQEADHVVVLNEGNVVMEDVPERVFEQVDMLEAIGLDVPFPMKMYQMLYGTSRFITYEGLVDIL